MTLSELPPRPPSIDPELLRRGLDHVLEKTHFPELGRRFEGKVRDSYRTRNHRRVLITTDRVSAFDQRAGTLPFKGQVLNELTYWWLEKTRDLVPNALLEVPDPNVMVCRECEVFPVEFVVRAYLTGITSTAIWTLYERGQRSFGGITLPERMHKHQRLPQLLLTPTTKAAEGGHDKPASREALIASGRISARDFDRAAELAMTLFHEGERICAERGLLLVDTKYEFGKTEQGEIVVVDEVHTPDSSRFWYRRSYEERFAQGKDPEPLDKEYLRRWMASRRDPVSGTIPAVPDEVRLEAAQRYIEACSLICGLPFRPNLEEPTSRIRRNLKLASTP